MNEILAGFEKAPLLHGQVASDLVHPWLVGIGGDARDVNLSGVELDQKEHVECDQPAQCPHFGAEAVYRPQDIHVTVDEVSPRRGLLALWG